MSISDQTPWEKFERCLQQAAVDRIAQDKTAQISITDPDFKNKYVEA